MGLNDHLIKYIINDLVMLYKNGEPIQVKLENTSWSYLKIEKKHIYSRTQSE